MNKSKTDYSEHPKGQRLPKILMTSLVIALVTTLGITMGFSHFSSFALTFDMKNNDRDDGDDGTKQQGQAGGICTQVSPGHMVCTPILKYNGHCGIEDEGTMTSYEVECP